MRFFKSFKKSLFSLLLLGLFLITNSGLAETRKSTSDSSLILSENTENVRTLNNELLDSPENETTALKAEANSDIYVDVVTKSFITVSQDPWEKAHANLLQVRRYWDREMEINPAQANIIENYQAVNNALQAYLIGSYALDKVSKPPLPQRVNQLN